MPLLRRDAYLLSLRTGRWRWYWALVGTVLVGVGYVTALSGLAKLTGLMQSTAATGDKTDNVTSAAGTDEDLRLLVPGDLDTYVILIAAFLPLTLVSIGVYRIWHGRRWGDWPFRRGRAGALKDFSRSAIAFLVVVSGGYAMAALLHPDRFAVVDRTAAHIPWLVLGCLVIFVQAFAEEVAFKGYLYRVWGAVFPYRWPLVIALSLAFTALHWDNTDFARDRGMAIVQFMVGSAISYWLYMRTRSLAAPTGLHWANNVFAMLILASAPGEFGVSAYATYTDPVLAAGRSNLTDLEAWTALILGNATFLALVGLRASPLYVPPYESVDASEPPPPSSQDRPATA
ncbi:MAG TPA: CPBP family intramembrane metalloprotease [Hyphomicrobiaceae bacterium]|nr:CPBP family intramembrane metalloprotease [Hyphomicrobiaceae bacterium]